MKVKTLVILALFAGFLTYCWFAGLKYQNVKINSLEDIIAHQGEEIKLLSAATQAAATQSATKPSVEVPLPFGEAKSTTTQPVSGK